MSGRRGFSLVELMIVLAIFSIIAVSSLEVARKVQATGQQASQDSLTSISLPITVLRADLQRAITVLPAAALGDPSAPAFSLKMMEVPMIGGAMGTPAPAWITYRVSSGPCPPPASTFTCKTLSRIEGTKQIDLTGLMDVAWCFQGDPSAALASCRAAHTSRVPSAVTPGKRFILSVRRLLSYGQPSDEIVTVIDLENKGISGGANPLDRPQMMKRK